MPELYNVEVKNRYLQSYENEGTQNTIRNIFLNAADTERTLGKDLYNFSMEDLSDVFKNLSPKSLSVSNTSGRFIKQYISWCITHGYRDNNDNPLNGADKEWYSKFVNRKLKIHYSYEEFIDLLEDKYMLNGQDQAFLFLIFSGVLGEKFSELTELRYEDFDFDNKTVFIRGRNLKLPLSEECLKYVEKAYNQQTYYVYNLKTKDFNEKELLPSPYLFKNVKSPRSTENTPVGMSVLYNRLHSLKELLDISHLTPNAIRQSGMIYHAVLLFEKYGVLGYGQLAIIGEQYNFSTITNTNNEKTYVYFNTFLMKDFLNESSINELYGIQAEFQKK
jgi:integrase